MARGTQGITLPEIPKAILARERIFKVQSDLIELAECGQKSLAESVVAGLASYSIALAATD